MHAPTVVRNRDRDNRFRVEVSSSTAPGQRDRFIGAANVQAVAVILAVQGNRVESEFGGSPHDAHCHFATVDDQKAAAGHRNSRMTGTPQYSARADPEPL